MDLERDEIDLPFNVRVYDGGYLGLAPITYIHDVTIWLHGELDHTQQLTLRRNGSLSLHHGGHKSGESANVFRLDWVRIQDDGDLVVDVDPVTEDGFTFWINQIWVEGGGEFKGNV